MWNRKSGCSRESGDYPEICARNGVPQGCAAIMNYPEREDDFAENAVGFEELPPGVAMTPKIPPAVDGTKSWFAFEELIYDWVDNHPG